MDLSLGTDIYEPNMDDVGNYVDSVPPSSKFKNGLRCPCGARREHIFDNRPCFVIHIKSKTHQKWLSGLNTNKMNYFTECEKLADLVNSQKIIIGRLEKEISSHKQTIVSLACKLSRTEDANSTTDLLLFD